MSMSCDKFPRILPQKLTPNCRKYVLNFRFCRGKVTSFKFRFAVPKYSFALYLHNTLYSRRTHIARP